MPSDALVLGHFVNNHRWCFRIIEAFISNALKQFSVVAIELSVSASIELIPSYHQTNNFINLHDHAVSVKINYIGTNYEEM